MGRAEGVQPVPIVIRTFGVTSTQVTFTSGQPSQTVLEGPVRRRVPQRSRKLPCAPRLKGLGDGNNLGDRDNQQPSS